MAPFGRLLFVIRRFSATIRVHSPTATFTNIWKSVPDECTWNDGVLNRMGELYCGASDGGCHCDGNVALGLHVPSKSKRQDELVGTSREVGYVFSGRSVGSRYFVCNPELDKESHGAEISSRETALARPRFREYSRPHCWQGNFLCHGGRT